VTLPTAATPPAGDTGQQEFPIPPTAVEELLRLFVKVIRAHQLYLPNNPVYQGAVNAVRNALGAVLQQTHELSLRFTETEIKWLDRPVLVENTKSSDSLPWTFFKDGVREIQLMPGFEQEELVKLLDILQRIRKASPDEDDLLSMLWQADFANLRYRYVDIGAEPTLDLHDGGTPPAKPDPGSVQAAAKEATEQNSIVNMQDFDATLYFLDEKELDYLRREIDREYSSDLRSNVIAILLDIYETQSAADVREEIGGLIENLIITLLAAGQLRSVAYLLAETHALVKRAPALTLQETARLSNLPERLSAEGPLGQLLQSLDESAELPPQSELSELFGQLRPSALSTIFAWLTRLQNPRIKSLVEHSADRLAGMQTGELAKLVGSSNKAVALEAIRRAGALKTASCVAPLAKVLVESDVEMRQQAVKSLTDIGSAGALQAMEKAIEDRDRDVRVAAVKALGAKAYRGVFSRIDTAVKGGALRSRDLTEKMTYFEAFGAMCGDGGVPFLDDLLNGKGMFGKREDPELRACAAMALGRVGTAKAREALQRATSEKEVVVRNAVNRALRGGAT
jgi:hypothetical protein